MGAQLQNAHLEVAQLQNAHLTVPSSRTPTWSLPSSRRPTWAVPSSRMPAFRMPSSRRQPEGCPASERRPIGAQLQNANLDFGECRRHETRLCQSHQCYYSPASPPPDSHVEGILGLGTLRVPYDEMTQQAWVSGLVLLRELLQKAGLRDVEREATFSIERAKTHHALDRWRERPLRAVEAVFRLIFFEWPVAYGLHPWRALQILLGLMLLLSFAYLPAIGRTARSPRTPWRDLPDLAQRPADRRRRLDKARDLRRRAGTTPCARLKAKSLIGKYGYALYFSLLSAFHIGWRELNVGTWLARLQGQEYTLRALGWPTRRLRAQSLSASIWSRSGR